MMNRHLVSQYHETKAKFTKFSNRLQNSQKRGEFQSLSRGKQNYLLKRIQKLWQKLLILEARLKITTTGVSLALILMVSNVDAQEQFVFAPEKNPMPSPTIFGPEPILVDLDNDGDLDLITASYYERGELYENTGTPSAPVFELVPDEDNPFVAFFETNVMSVGGFHDAGDLDGDGDVDLLTDAGYIIWNTGSNDAIVYEMEPDGLNLYIGMSHLGDIDGDGDLDLVGMSYGDSNVDVYENVGDANTFNITGDRLQYDVSGWSDEISDVDNIYVVDMDNDGDLDLVLGVDIYDYYAFGLRYETIKVIENTGSSDAPVFALKEDVDNPYRDIDVDRFTLGDLDDDGDFDVLLFEYLSGHGIQYFELDNNTVAENKDLIPELYDGMVLPISYVLTPQFVDYDGDGDLDIIAFGDPETFLYSSDAGNLLNYYEYKDTGEQLKYTLVENKSFEFIDPEKMLQLPFFVDLDSDGDMDLIMVSYDYTTEKIEYIYMENTGSDSSPVYKEHQISGLTDGATFIIPFFADMDGDGDVDILGWGDLGYGDPARIRYFESTSSDPIEFTERTGADNPVAMVTYENFPDLMDYINPAIADIDEDGDYDLLFPGLYGLHFLENTGSPTDPEFVDKSQTGPFSSLQVGYYSSVNLADVDGDGDMDLLVHEYYGMITSFYENTGATGNSGFTKMSIHSMDIYPNPVSDLLQVNLGDGESGQINFEIISLESRQILNGSVSEIGNTSQFSIDTGHLSSGQYVLKVRSGKKLFISKFVKL